MSSLIPSYSSSQNHPAITFPDSRSRQSRSSTGRRFESTTKPVDISSGLLSAMMVVALVGLGLATYLSWAALTSSQVAGCGGGQIFNCSHVLHSKWSKVAGIPVAIPATTLYLVALISLSVALLTTRERLRKFAIAVVGIAALSAGLAALWFTLLQVFVVEHFCSYCLAAHACGLTLSGVVLWKLPLGLRQTLCFSGVGLAGIVAIASAQVLAEETRSYEVVEHRVVPSVENSSPDPNSIKADNLFGAPGFDVAPEKPAPSDNNVFEAPDESGSSRQSRKRYSALISTSVVDGVKVESRLQENPTDNSKQEKRKLISISGGQVQLDVEQWPLVGSTGADQTFVEMFDYNCPHCRTNHRFVKAALDQLENKVAMIAISVPMNTQCNNSITVNDPVHRDACELARLSVAVWRVEPAKFTVFHHWLFKGDSAPTATNARAYAGKLVDARKLEAEIASDVPGQYVAKQVELYKTIGAGTVPKLLFSGSTVNGSVNSTETLLSIIQQKNGQR